MTPLCWQLDTTNIYITKSLITMNNILCPINSIWKRTYGKEPQNDGSFFGVVDTCNHPMMQYKRLKAIPTPQHKSKPTMVSVTPKKTPDLTKPCYTEDILPVSWPFIILRFYSK